MLLQKSKLFSKEYKKTIKDALDALGKRNLALILQGVSFPSNEDENIGFGILSYVIIDIIVYLVDLIKAAVKKTEKPVWDLSVITIIVAILFIVYFFVPLTF